MSESSSQNFNHLKIHSQYSICEGAIKIDDLQDFSKQNKLKSLAICDTSNLCGALEFAEKISKVGTQPIIGTQINFKYADCIGLLPLFALNEEGYKRIIKLSSTSYLENDELSDPHINFNDLLNDDNLTIVNLTTSYMKNTDVPCFKIDSHIIWGATGMMLSEIKERIEDKTEITIDDLKDYVKDWRNLGRVPHEMRHIEGKFNKVLDKIVDKSDLEKQDVEMIKFENLVNSYLEQKNYRKLDSEQLFIRKKIDETVREIQQLENNIGFISNVSEDNPLVKNVRNQIDVYKEKLEIWKSKLNYLRELEN